MILCRRCRNLNEDDAKFCVYCRSLLEWEGERVDTPPASPIPAAVAPVAPDPRSTQQILLGAPPAVHPGPERAAPAPTPAQAPAPTPGPHDVVCRSCGTGNDRARTFCRRCGATLAATAPRPAPPPPEPRWSPRQLDPAKLRSVVAVVLASSAAFAVFGPVRPRLIEAARSVGEKAMRTVAPNVSTVAPLRVEASAALPEHEPAMLTDSKSTSWAAPGAGQQLVFTFDPPVDLARVYFVVDGGSTEFTHPSGVIVTANGRSARTTLGAARKPQRVKLEVDDVTSVTVEILSTADPARPVALLEVAFYAFE